MAIRLLPPPRFRVVDGNGDPLVGGKVYTYQPGTSTPKATYTDYTGNTANDNPVQLDARGEGTIYFDGTYKIVVKDANDVEVWTEDNFGEGYDSTLTGNFNLSQNGSFEIDTNGDGEPDNWTVTEYTGGTVSRDSTDQYHGRYALKFLSTGSGGGFATSDFFEVQEGLVYAVNFAIKSSVVDIHNLVEIVWYTGAQAVISTTAVYDDAATNPTSWTYKTLEATAPANARYARVRLTGAKDDDTTSGTCWFDNVAVVDIDTLYGFRFPNLGGDVTATAAELNVTDGLTASTAELNTLDGITATVTELNYLDGATAGTVLTTGDEGSGNGIDADTVDGVELAEIYELASAEAPAASTALDVDVDVTPSTWESVGPTGSGATNIWTALDAVPSGAAWVEVSVIGIDAATNSFSMYVNARQNGSAVMDLAQTRIFANTLSVGGATSVNKSEISRARVPISEANVFDVYWSSNGTATDVKMYLCGWGY